MEKWVRAGSQRSGGTSIDAYAAPGTDLEVVSAVSSTELRFVAICLTCFLLYKDWNRRTVEDTQSRARESGVVLGGREAATDFIGIPGRSIDVRPSPNSRIVCPHRRPQWMDLGGTAALQEEVDSVSTTIPPRHTDKFLPLPLPTSHMELSQATRSNIALQAGRTGVHLHPLQPYLFSQVLSRTCNCTLCVRSRRN